MQYTSPPVIPEPSESARATETMGGSMRALLCLASLGAAVIHFAFAPDHMSQSTSHGLFFMAIAWFGVAWAVGLVLGKPSRAWFVAGVAVNLGIIAVWVVSRTVGISGQVEAVGFPDALATVLAGVVVLGSLAYIATRVPRLAVREVSGAAFIGGSPPWAAATTTATTPPPPRRRAPPLTTLAPTMPAARPRASAPPPPRPPTTTPPASWLPSHMTRPSP